MIPDFVLWTITTALFNELHIQSAAKGESIRDILGVNVR